MYTTTYSAGSESRHNPRSLTVNPGNYNLISENAIYKNLWLPEVVEMRAEHLASGAILLNENNDRSFPTRMGFKMGRAEFPDPADKVLWTVQEDGMVEVVLDRVSNGLPRKTKVFMANEMVKVAGIAGGGYHSTSNSTGLFYKLFYWKRSDFLADQGFWHWDVVDGIPCWISEQGAKDNALWMFKAGYAEGTCTIPFAPAAPWVLEGLKHSMGQVRG